MSIRGSCKFLSFSLLVLLTFSSAYPVYPLEVTPGQESSHFNYSRIAPFDHAAERAIESKMKIGRLEMQNPKSQVAIWMPLVEPAPIIKNRLNEIADNVRIYRNVGPTATDFPYIVEEVGGDHYVYRNVRYHWFFEQPDADKVVHAEGNRNGVSGGGAWNPWLRIERDADRQFFYDVTHGTKSPSDVWDKKLFVNVHTSPYDSGVTDLQDYDESTILQQVGMIMTYERARVSPTNKAGTAFPQTNTEIADPVGQIGGTAVLTSAPDDSAFEKFGPNETAKAIPAVLSGSWNLTATIDGQTYTKFTEYNMVYVEDYEYPEIPPELINPTGQTFRTQVGGYLGEPLQLSTTQTNTDLQPDSPAIENNITYSLGADELYSLPNPFRNGKTINFYFLKSNSLYGPYIGKYAADKEYDYYKFKHPYWKTQSDDVVRQHISNRAIRSWSGNFLEPWEKAMVYYYEYAPTTAALITEQFNQAWKEKSVAPLVYFDDMVATLAGRPQEAQAREAANSLRTFITSGSGNRQVSRFWRLHFGPESGRLSVPEFGLENIPSQFQQTTGRGVDDTGRAIDILEGSWTTPGQRFIMPRFYATNSLEWNSHCPTPPASGNITELRSYYQALRETPPDMLLSQQVSNCCGNDADAGSLILCEDRSEFSKPMIDFEIEDLNNAVTHQISIPSPTDLSNGDMLVKVANDGTRTEYPNGCDEDVMDMASGDWIIEKANGDKVELPKVPTDPDGPQGSYLPVEDQRLRFSIKPFDNIDSLSNHRGILKTVVEIEALDDNRQPTGNLEEIEYESAGKFVAGNQIVKAFDTSQSAYDLYSHDPNIDFYHIFRAPGWYQVRATAYDRGEDGEPGLSRQLRFNVNVMPARFQTRTIDSRNN